MFELLPNDCFQFDMRRHRYLTSIPGFIYAIDIDDRIALPIRWSLDEFRGLVNSKSIFFGIEVPMPTRPHTESIKDRRRGAMRYHHVQALLCRPGILDKASRGRSIREYSKESGVSRDSLLDWLRKYWQGGQCPDAVMWNYYLSGRVPETNPIGNLC